MGIYYRDYLLIYPFLHVSKFIKTDVTLIDIFIFITYLKWKYLFYSRLSQDLNF